MHRSTLLAVVVLLAPVAAADDAPPGETKPPYERLLTGEDAARAAELQRQMNVAAQADQIGELIRCAEHLLTLRTRIQGADHWETVNQRWLLDELRKQAELEPAERDSLQLALQNAARAQQLESMGQFAQAEPLWQEFCRTCERIYGRRNPSNIVGLNNLAANLLYQQKHAEAKSRLQQALDLCRDVYGEHHPSTAVCYNNLGGCFNGLGEFDVGQPLHQQALDLRREQLGERHPLTAVSYSNLATCLSGQGKYAEAQPLFERALALCRELQGERHRDTALNLHNLAANLLSQGQYSDAQLLLEMALKMRRDLLGEEHAETAESYNALAACLQFQRKNAAAQPLFQTALDLRRKVSGERHPDTAQAYNNLANVVAEQGKYADAQPLYQMALELRREQLGEYHPVTAQAYQQWAFILHARREFADADTQFQTALNLYRETLGANHPEAGQCCLCLAENKLAQGNYADARPLLERAADSYEAARLNVASRGLDRAMFGAERSPYGRLAATLARLGDSAAAWLTAERDLARGSGDEAAARSRVALTADEQRRRTELYSRLNAIQRQALHLFTKQSGTQAEQDELSRLKMQRQALEAELSALAVAMSQRELASLEQVQAALPVDSALVLWVDFTSDPHLKEHWGCVIRMSGDPVWEPLPGTGAEGTWTDDDSGLARKLQEAVSGQAPAAEVADLSRRLTIQRIAPLEPHLDGIRRLFVVAVDAMAGVPVDVLTDKYIVSYVPSGTFLAQLEDRAAASSTSLLALGDPVFPQVASPDKLPLPPGGLLITQVTPESNAWQARLRAGDVLLDYAGAALPSRERLAELIERHESDESVAVTVWRDGTMMQHKLPGGRMGIVPDPLPAPKAIAARWKADQMLAHVSRGGEWAELPGTSVEVARLRRILGEDQTTALTRSDASEQALEQLRAAGKLKDFRYLHFATHGEPNNARAFESALILAQDQITGEIPKGGGRYYDGRLTANEVLENWELNADLVTLSACESALGRPGGGDGLLGFAQAFLLAGARSVCLSLWKVDDTATALLMDRFYQNLLGKREGLKQPMPKAESLAEAKQWLRTLSREEAEQLWNGMASGVERGTGEAAIPLVPADDHPYSHPRYWAAFVLIGSPE